MKFSLFFQIAIVAASCLSTEISWAAMPSIVKTYISNKSHVITEDSQLPLKSDQTAEFVASVVSNWRQIFAEMGSISEDTNSQSLVIVAGEFLSPKDYVAFVESLCELRSKNEVTAAALRFVLWSGMAKRNFLAFNFDRPEIAVVLSKLEILINRDFPGEWTLYFDELKSGKMKDNLIRRASEGGYPLPESFDSTAKISYQNFSGGSVLADMKSISTNPVQALAELKNPNRVKWSMVVAFIALLCLALGLWRLIVKIKNQRAKK